MNFAYSPPSARGMRQRFLRSHSGTHGQEDSGYPGARYGPCAGQGLPVSTDSPGHEVPPDGPIVIGNPLANSPPDFPPLQTVHERFHSHGFPSFTNCYSNQQQVSCCSNVIASIPANFLSLFSLSSCCLFSCTVCMIAEIVPFCVA